MSEQASTAPAPSAVPSYARPSVGQRLTKYSNQDAEHIRAAFQPNSYVSIGGLGKNPGESGQLGFKVGHSGHTTFSDFTYTCSPYELSEEQGALSREEHDEKTHQIAQGQPFFAGYSNHKAKYEGALGYMSEPYDLKEADEREERWVKESKSIAGPFIPAGVEKALVKPTRALLGDIMSAFFRSIAEDWPEAQPTVLSTAEDLITVYFLRDRVKSEAGLLAYMNNALRRNEVVTEYNLRKVVPGWHKATKDNRWTYTLRPPWVRPRAFVAGEGDPEGGGEEQQGRGSQLSSKNGAVSAGGSQSATVSQGGSRGVTPAQVEEEA